MARKPRSASPTNGTRQAGYVVTIKGFVQINKDSLDDQIAALSAMKEAAAGDVTSVVGLMSGIEVKNKLTSRIVGGE